MVWSGNLSIVIDRAGMNLVVLIGENTATILRFGIRDLRMQIDVPICGGIGATAGGYSSD